MLHKIILENYRSFGTRGEISLYPNPKRTFYPSHIYSGEELLYPVLKHCLIVGPNASGKTNLVKGMKFIKEFCCGQQHHDPKDKWLNRWYYDNRFNLPVAEDEAPIHFMNLSISFVAIVCVRKSSSSVVATKLTSRRKSMPQRSLIPCSTNSSKTTQRHLSSY